MHDWKELLMSLRLNNIWQNMAPQNLVLEIRYATTLILQIHCFMPRSTIYEFCS